jgi:hypothetical protein
VPIPHDLDGTWCKVIGAMLGYALLVDSSRVPTTATSCNRDQADMRRRLRDAHVRIHCRSLAMTESFHHGRVQSSNARRTGG